ncbi:MAG: aldolase/citrate lyase family protein [Geminicoccaceae bacterium]
MDLAGSARRWIGGSFEQSCAGANARIMLVVMVETEEAANVREIMARRDVVLIGPGDLMVDVKARGHEDHEGLASGSRRHAVAADRRDHDSRKARRRLSKTGCSR